MSTVDGLERLGALVMNDLTLQDALGRAEDTDGFIALAIAAAGARGIALDAAALRAALPPDPLGLSRWSASAISGTQWPPPGWLPIQVAALGDQLVVDWAYVGGAPLQAPFFEGEVRQALARPFGRLFRYRMTLADFLSHADGTQSLTPSGLIFHMSRCGSTLVSQMLAAAPRNIVVSEAAPVDTVALLSRARPPLPDDQPLKLLRAMVAAFGRRRGGGERHYVLKLDAWHTLALPLFRRAFPGVPWLFLYREPAEVLVSQIRERGPQLTPEIVHPSLYGIDTGTFMTEEQYCARVLARICQAAVDNGDDAHGLFVNYRALPQAMWSRILPHFGIAPDDAERAAMQRAAGRDTKAPGQPFADDRASKSREVSDAIRAAAAQHLDAVYGALEALAVRG